MAPATISAINDDNNYLQVMMATSPPYQGPGYVLPLALSCRYEVSAARTTSTVAICTIASLGTG